MAKKKKPDKRKNNPKNYYESSILPGAPQNLVGVYGPGSKALAESSARLIKSTAPGYNVSVVAHKRQKGKLKSGRLRYITVWGISMRPKAKKKKTKRKR